jgi:hypothetical protein
MNATDAMALSVGKATYNKSDISAKVWRYDFNNDRWKRQSEEMPLHRVFDLAILTIASFLKDTESGFPISSLKETYSNVDYAKELPKYYKENKAKIKPRLVELERLIAEFNKMEHKIISPSFK